jgi:hypothetical protein
VTLANAAYKPDLDGYMADLGYAYISTDPLDTPLDASQTLSVPVVFQTMPDAAIPGAGNLTLYNDNWARQLLAVKRDSGDDYPLQPHIGDVGFVVIMPGTGSTPTILGGGGVTTTGTMTHPTLANTNALTSGRRMSIASASTAGSSAGIRGSAATCWRGNAAGLGGFHFGAHFALSTAVAGQRAFVGLAASTAALSNTDPSNIVNMVGVGRDTGDANMQLFVNDQTGVATKIDLGASFPRSATDTYEVFFACNPNGTSIEYVVENRANGAIVTGSLTTNLPQNTVFLNLHAWTNNSATASVASIDVQNAYIESDL